VKRPHIKHVSRPVLRRAEDTPLGSASEDGDFVTDEDESISYQQLKNICHSQNGYKERSYTLFLQRVLTTQVFWETIRLSWRGSING